MTINLEKTTIFIRKLLPEAGKILLNYFRSANLEVQAKGEIDIVSEPDLEVDKFLRRKIGKKYPKIPFLTEESAHRDLAGFKNLENLWVIDPLDGTVNYSRGHPNFAISVAFVNKGVTKLGVVYIPVTKETYWAQVNLNQSFLNGKPISVSKVDDLRKSSFICDWVPEVKERKVMLRWLEKIAPHVRQIKSMGSAVSDIVSLAAGVIDVYINPGLKPWDLAAASLIVQKAGGTITTSEGKTWDIFNPNAIITNGILHNHILSLISPT